MSSPGVQAVRRAGSNITRLPTGSPPSREAWNSATHIELRNVPRTATPADLRRLITRSKLQGVSDAAIDYTHFMPNERAVLTLTRPNFLRDNLRALDRTTIGSIPISAHPKLTAEEPPARLRGAKGRAEAIERGIITGNGPHAKLSAGETVVTIWGLPGRLPLYAVSALVDGFKLAPSENGKPNIIKINIPEGEFSMFSRYLVTMASASEAHRLVRHLHMTEYEPSARESNRTPLRARVVY